MENLPNPAAPPVADPGPAPGQAPAPPVVASPPPAAQIVLEGTRTERELALERDIKDREIRIAELEDQNRQLKTPPTPAPRKPAPEKKSWLSGATLLDD